MNNYFTGIASLLDIYATQRTGADSKLTSWDDFSALQSDWEKISEDLKFSITAHTSEIASLLDQETIDNLRNELHNLEIMNDLLAELNIESNINKTNLSIYDIPLINLQPDIQSHNELLKKIDQKLINEQRNIKEKEIQ